MRRLTDEQRQFAGENHNLIYAFLHKNKLDIDTWYGIVAIGYTKAVAAYDPTKGTFSTWAFMAMQQAVWMERRYQNSTTRSGKVVVSLDCPLSQEGTATLGDHLDSGINLEDQCLSRIALEQALPRLTERQRIILRLLAAGITQVDIARRLNIGQSQISRERKAAVHTLTSQKENVP